jgi:hypothetical protein
MKRFLIPSRKMIALLVLAAFTVRSVTPVNAASPIKLNDWDGAIDLQAKGPAPFTLTGTDQRLGTFRAIGEVEFRPGKTKGSLIGQGVAVFEAASGDLLTAEVTWTVDAWGGDYRTSAIQFSWRDSIEFQDGTFVPTTGDFVDDKPQPLVVIAIIAILIGLLLPAVQ